MITIYGIKNCNKIRNTIKWLEEHETDYKFVDVKKDPIKKEKLADLVNKLGLDAVINKRGMKWKQLGLAKEELSEEELFDKLAEHQTMIKRPLLVDGEAAIIGYDEDAFETFIS